MFLDLPPRPAEDADAVVVPLPFERTVSYGEGTGDAPRAILEATSQVEAFDEETRVDFERAPRVHTAEPLLDVGGTVVDYLRRMAEAVAAVRGRFVVGLGGEHTLTWGMVMGLAERLADVTIVQVDAHADLADTLDGLHWSHGTVMRRLWEQGCRIVQVGVRSLSREEYELASGDDRITAFYGYELPACWDEALACLRSLEGDVYLTFDIDGLDPSVVPSTGTPQPDGLSWRQAMAILRALFCQSACRVVGADLVEFVPSPYRPGCDIIAARLLTKLLAFWWRGRAPVGAPR